MNLLHLLLSPGWYRLTVPLLWLAVSSLAFAAILKRSLHGAPPPLLNAFRGYWYRTRYTGWEDGAIEGRHDHDDEERLVGTVRPLGSKPVMRLDVDQDLVWGPQFVPTFVLRAWRETRRRIEHGEHFVLETKDGASYLVETDSTTTFVPTFTEFARNGRTRQLRGEIGEGTTVIVYGTLERGSINPTGGTLRDPSPDVAGRFRGVAEKPLLVADVRVGLGQRAFWSGPHAIPQDPNSWVRRLMLVARFVWLFMTVGILEIAIVSHPNLPDAGRSLFAESWWTSGVVGDAAIWLYACLRPYRYRVIPDGHDARYPSRNDVLYFRVSWPTLACVSRWMVAQRLPLHSPVRDDAEMIAMQAAPAVDIGPNKESAA